MPPELITVIKTIEDYLGPKVQYTSDRWPNREPELTLMMTLHQLKLHYYAEKVHTYRRRRKLKKVHDKWHLDTQNLNQDDRD